MVVFEFTQFAKKRLSKFSKAAQSRIIEKLRELKNHDDIFSVLKRLHHFEPATHRLRIGPYRLILELQRHAANIAEFLVLDVGDRKEIYR